MRKFKKILGLVTVLMLVLTMLPTSVFAAGSYTASASKTTLTVGKTATLTITAKSSAGKFTVSSSNPSVATVNKEAVFIDGSHENASSKITIKAVAEGTTTITVTPADVSDNEYNLLTNTKTIKITVKKATTTTDKNTNTTTVKSSDATLKSLSSSVAYIDFSKDTTKYTVNVDSNVKSLGLQAVANSSKATVKITGDKNFVAGENVVKVVVTAEDGATKTYTVTVVKKAVAKAPLLDLDVKGHNMSPEFKQDTLVYSVDAVGITEVELDYLLADKDSKVTIQGADDLKVGRNEVKLIVTQKDGTVTTYTVNVYVTAEQNSSSIWVIVILILVLLIVAETIYIVVKQRKNMEDAKKEVKAKPKKQTKK